MRYLALIVISFFLQGCSTVHTISHAESGLVMKGSYCHSIERMYSGVQYNWCKLHGEPKKAAATASTKGDFEYVGIDTLFSLLADTLVLPYTIFKQASSEPISVRSSE